eukprot:scaffold1992_cov113-Cylindrotheca_fusiformis.AAC.21
MMNDLVLSEDGHAIQADDYHDDEDWYETQPGDEISGHGNSRRLRRGNYPFYMLVCVAVVIAVAIGASRAGGSDDTKEANLKATPSPAPAGGPFLSPTAKTSPPTMKTLPPTSLEDGISDFLGQYVEQKYLKEDGSYLLKAFEWLMENGQISTYGHSRIRQRFALASIYYATNEEMTWKNETGWLNDDDECSWHGVTCSGGEILVLNLRNNGLQGLFPDEITMLKKHLLELTLEGNSLSNDHQELRWIGEMTALRILDLESTTLTADGIPSYIGRLTNLEILDIAKADFAGELKGSVFKDLKKLKYADIGGIAFNSTLPNELLNLPNLNALYAYENGIVGELEDFLPESSQILELWLDDNSLSGSIPPSIGKHTALASLSLSDNALTGSLPTEIGQLVKMEQMWVYSNYLTGTVPSEIGHMTDLEILGIEDNDINGTVPTEVCSVKPLAFGADCEDDEDVSCDCCTCCSHPCPTASLDRLQEGNDRRLFKL